MRSALASFLSVAARCSDRPVAASANLPGAAGIALSILALFATDPLFAPSHPSRVHAADARPEPDDKPLTPAQSLSLLKTPDDLRVDLIAAEPLVVSPVAMAFDEQGRLFVAENRGYPTGPKEGEPQPGRIVQLIDRDADGQYDSRLDFATELSFPNGLMPWKGGLIVTCSPDILFLEDTNNDGRADKRQVLFTGFSTQGSTQLRTSHPTLGPDGWIYTTNGLMGGQVISLQQPDQKPVSLAGQDFRFDPQSGAYEAIDGRAQFGLTFDDFGHRFICYNRVHVQHVVLSSAILRRNPFLAFSETVQNCPAEMQPEPSRGHGRSAAIFPLSQNVTTADSHAGTFTAACGVYIYRGDALPEIYRGGVFACDPTGNLVHFDKLTSQGGTFIASRIHPNSEFLASPDNWFRPVFVTDGPDGALYVCDMGRRTIEHPDYLPVEIRKHTDFESGKNLGRIWRVSAKEHSLAQLRQRAQVNFTMSTPEQLVAELGSANGWRREAARRMLIEQQNPAAIPLLKTTLTAPDLSSATRAAAFSCLVQANALEDERLVKLLSHPDARLRELAVQRIALSLRKTPASPVSAELRTGLIGLAKDPDSLVRFQVAIALGDLDADPAIIPALASIARQDGADKWFRAALFSSIRTRDTVLLTALRDPASRTATEPRLSPDLLLELARLLGASQPPAQRSAVLSMIFSQPAQQSFDETAALLTGYLESLRSRGIAAGSNAPLVEQLIAQSGSAADLTTAVTALREKCRTQALDSNTAEQDRQLAIALLAQLEASETVPDLIQLATSDQPASIRTAAIRALALSNDPRAMYPLVVEDRFGRYPPAVRDELIGSILSHPQHYDTLLSALESGAVPTTAIDALRRQQLNNSRDPSLRTRAQKLFSAVAGDRAKVYDDLKSCVDLPPKPAQGKLIFQKNCANCHRLDREGFTVGPDLFGIRNQPKAAILLHILVPDQEITSGFTAYNVLTKDGRTLAGLISSETATSVTLRQPGGKEETILRSDIDELTASKLSLMPQGLEKNLTAQDFADLLAYLKGEK